ncbi:hypothetical protein ALC60_13227 [Trachymyrmex zeteki]|uniref:uncharacterized protein n=1 Tax=Mycetomoellerius zeteki TaxID=64791 RepID=UPI00084E8780|nr:PREDICTED: uncharacterized protein LOC108720148 [Trachymyrmex zeteki]KYQ54174.1 hypothetical protein ALC60_13227 [Trachymyrmex zeteki]
MPNFRGSMEEKRRLFAGTLMSVLMYGAPVWADDIGSNKEIQTILRRTQKNIAGRIACTYKTVAYEATMLLATMIPADILAIKYKNLYLRIKDLRNRGIGISEKAKDILKTQASSHAVASWKRKCERRGGYGRRVREMIALKLEEWYQRKVGRVTFHMTQIISGHGCFSSYLYKINS